MQQIIKIMFPTFISMALHIFIRICPNSTVGFSVYVAAESNWTMLAQVQVFHGDRLLSFVLVCYWLILSRYLNGLYQLCFSVTYRFYVTETESCKTRNDTTEVGQR